MEDYKKFVDFNLSRLKRTKDVDENKPKSPSLICFHGRPILPPLLSGAQREEMGKLKETAQKAAERNRKHKDDTRMSYVQTILHSVHIRKTPTLEELLKESDFGTRASPSDSISGSLSQNIFTKKYLHVQESLHPLTSTTCSDLLTSHLPPQTRYNEIRHNFPQDSETALDLHSSKTYFHQLYSCYDSYTNVENTIMAIGSQKEDIFCSGEDSVEGFLVHNSSDTVKKMPDIINYPPVDGEDLERSGQESSFGIDLKAENPQSSSINPSSAEESCDVYPVQTETSHLATQNDNDQEVELKEDLTGPLKDPPALTYLTEIHSQLSKTMQTDEEDSAPSEEPYRMSLQALLKKSQEYRRRQRMLRSQAKSAKIQHRTQDQPKSEEQSLSDKENDEQHTKVTEPRKGQERNDSHSSIVDQSLKRSCESDRKTDIFDESHLTIDNPAQTYVINPNSESYDSIRVHNWVNTSGNRNVSLPMPVWTENMSKSSECSANTSPLAFNDIKKYQNIPVLNFCRSPVPCKAKSPSAPFDKITQKEPVINTSINNDQVEGSKNRTSPVSVIESDVTSVLAKSSQHIDQLEFNLSGLKVLISDLECTLTENVDKSNSQSESQQTQISQNDSVCWSGDASLSQRSLSPDSLKRSNDKTSLIETETVNSQQHVMAMTTSREKDHTRVTASKCQNIRRLPSAKGTLTTAQRMCIPDIFRTCLPEATIRNNVSVLSDTSNHSVKIYSDLGRNSHCTSLNQSYDVDTPSELWLHSVYESQRREKKYMTPKCGVEGQGVGSKVKRRLQMTEVVQEREAAASRASSSTPKAAARWHEGLGSVKERQEQLRQIHAAQIRELQEEHQRQQQQLLQTLAERYHLLQIMSLPCSVSTSRLGDTVTFPTLSQSILSAVAMSRYDSFITTLSNSHALLALHWYNQQPSSIPLPDHYRHLLSAAAKGFLTRRLLRTERVVQLVRTARDTHQFLQAFQKHSPNKGLPSRQDLMLQERVTLQLHAARFEIHNIFFSLTTRERMQLISSDRDLARERELKRQNGPGGQHRGKSLLSAATQKSLERKRGLMIQKKTAERHRGVSMRSRHKPGFTAQQPLETQAGQYRANPQRVPKSTYTSRPQ